ncbi:MAG: DUF1833 family protein [Pseudomonadota bacterium]
MPRNYSVPFKETIHRTGAPEAPLLLLEINHVDLATPIRVVNDNLDLVSNGNTYTAMAFRALMPDDLDQSQPRAALAIDNVGKELTTWLESSGGGEGATVTMRQVLRSAPNTIEWEATLNLSEVQTNLLEVTGTLSFDDTLNLPAVPLTYRPDVAPGIF